MTSREVKYPAAVLCLASALLLVGCGNQNTPTAVPANTTTESATSAENSAPISRTAGTEHDGHSHADGDDHSHTDNDPEDHHADGGDGDAGNTHADGDRDARPDTPARTAKAPVPHDHDGDGIPDHGPGAHKTDANDGFNARDVANTDRTNRLGDTRATSTQPAVEGPLKVSPDEILLGQIATGDTGVGSMTLANTGDTPMTVTKIKTSCGCTTSSFKPGTTLQPGEEVQVEVKMKAGTVARTLRKTLTVIVEGQADVVLPVVGEAVAFVEVTPRTLNPEDGQTGTLTLTSIDDHPFKITSMAPPVIDQFADEAKVEHVLSLDWAVWNEVTAGRPNRKLTFYTDHPMAGQVYATVQIKRPTPSADDRNRDLASTRRPQQTPSMRIGAMLKAGTGADVMKKITEENLDLETIDGSGNTLLAQAAKYGNAGVVRALVEAGADIEAMDRQGATPLMAAAQSKNPATVEALINAGASLDTRDNIGRTALSCASGLGDPQSVKALIDSGAAVEVVGSFTGFTPLIWAAGFGESASVPALVDAGANLEATDFIEGATPLIHASRTGKTDSVKALLKAGAKLENTDRNGKTAFIAAAGASNGSIQKLEALLGAGADLNAKDNRGLTALDWAKKRTDGNSDAVIKFLEQRMAK